MNFWKLSISVFGFHHPNSNFWVMSDGNITQKTSQTICFLWVLWVLDYWIMKTEWYYSVFCQSKQSLSGFDLTKPDGSSNFIFFTSLSFNSIFISWKLSSFFWIINYEKKKKNTKPNMRIWCEAHKIWVLRDENWELSDKNLVHFNYKRRPNIGPTYLDLMMDFVVSNIC